MPRVKLTFASGDVQRYDAELAAHTNLVKWLESTGSVSYGLPQTLNELDDVGKETLESLYPNEVQISSIASRCLTLPYVA